MLRMSDSITVSQPPSQVLAFVADLSNIPKWQVEVVKSKVVTPGPTKVGTRFTDVTMGPMRSTADCEVSRPSVISCVISACLTKPAGSSNFTSERQGKRA